MIKKLISSLASLLIFISVITSPNAHSYVSQDSSNLSDPLAIRKSLGQNFDVGQFTGAAHYQYPLTLPPSPTGLTPSFSLSFNSQDSSLDNKAGYHWSYPEYYISRYNKMGVDKMYDRQDFLAVLPFESGEILPINASPHGTYGQRFESAFATYEFLADSSWLVTTKEGMKYYLGTSAASRQDDPSDPNRIFKWMLEKIEDTNGNAVTFDYKKYKGQIYLRQLSYANVRLELHPFNVADPYGFTRSDWHRGFATGFEVESQGLLYNLKIYVDDIKRQQIDLNFYSATGMALKTIQSITETHYDQDGNATVKPVTTFDYSDTQVSFTNAEGYEEFPIVIGCEGCVNDTQRRHNFFVIDHNGDGLDDVLYKCPRITPTITTGPICSPGDADFQDLWVAYNQGDGSWDYQQASSLDPFVSGSWSNSSVSNTLSTKLTDMNGDLAIDRVYSSTGGQYAPFTWNSRIHLSPFARNQEIYDTIPARIGLQNHHSTSYADNGVAVTDLNGDGLPDLVRGRYVAGVGYQTESCLNSGGEGCQLSDLWEVPQEHRIIHDSSGAQTSHQNPRNTFFQDCNLDGLGDYRFTGSGGGVFYNDGQGGWVEGSESSYHSNVHSCGHSLLNGEQMHDFNGDGLFDIVKSVYGEVGNVYLNNGGFTGQDQLEFRFPSPLIRTSNPAADFGVEIMDVNADKLPDVVRTRFIAETPYASSHNLKEIYYNTSDRPYFLKTINHSNGSKTHFEYKTSGQYRHEDGARANQALPFLVDTVSKVTIDDGLRARATTDFFYDDGHFYYNGPYERGFVGFGKVISTDEVGNHTINHYHQSEFSVQRPELGEYEDHISKKGRLYRKEIRDPSGMAKQEVINLWNTRDLQNERIFPYLEKTTNISLS